MAFRKLFFKRVTGIRDNYLLQEGDIALDEDDFQLYRGDGSTIGGIAITSTGGTSADTVSTGNGTDVTVTGGESTASGSTGGNTIITGGIGVTTGGNTNIIGGAGGTTGGSVNINGGNGSTDGNINIGTENTTLITIGTSGNNIDFPATTTVDFTGATVTGLSVSGIGNDIKNDTTPQLGGNLDLNSFDITGTGDINITGTVTASGGVTFSGTTDFDTITTDGLSISDNSISANRSNDDLTLSASGTGNVNINSNAKFNDDVKLLIGDSDDLQIWHNATNSIIQNATGQLQLRGNTIRLLNAATDEDFAFFNDDGSVDLYHNNTKRFETTSTGASVTGIFNIGDGSVSDNYIGLGAANDLKIFHNGSHSIIRETGTGSLYVQSDNNVILGSDSGSETYVKGIYNGAVELYHNNIKKFNTGSHGVDIVDEAHIEGATPHLTLKRTDNANVPTLRFKGSGGTVGASINFDGTSGTANELAFQTYDGASLAERFRVTYTGAKVSGNLQLGSTTAVSSVLDEDNLASDSATALATQQSIKAYVDGRFTQTTTTVNTLATDGLTITDNNVSANRTNDDLILSSSGTGDVVINSDMKFYDDDQLKFGDDNDLRLYHTGGVNYVDGTGATIIRGNWLYLRKSGSTENYIICKNDAAVEVYYDNSKKLETTSDGISVTDHIALADNGELRLGTDNDMQISHSGVSGLVKSTTGTLVLQGSTVRIQDAGSSQTAISAADGVATLYHTNTAVLNTTAGGIQIEKGVQEKFATITGASGVTALDCSNGHIFYKTGCTGDITANFTNLTLTAEYAVNLMVIINQGGTPYEVTAVQIGGSAQTINWQGGSQPTGNANGIDAFSFTILNDGGSYVGCVFCC